MSKQYDFSGWATKHDIVCSDKRIITKDAFKHNDGVTVPLVWNHRRNEMENIIGNVVLEHREEGVYAYGKFNNTQHGVNAKELVKEGDITSLSIYANRLKQQGDYVCHGEIREVSLVLAGANPGAHIDFVMEHSDGEEVNELFYYSNIDLEHTDGIDIENEVEHQNDKEETIADIVNEMTDKQKNVMYALIADAVNNNSVENNNSEGENDMKHNIFDNNSREDLTLQHAEFIDASLQNAKKYGSLKESFLAHAGTYGIDNIDYLFPDDTKITNEPIFIDRDQAWVSKLWAGTSKSPFSRLKAIYADITADEARALGYITGTLKKEEVFPLLKRTTSPTTVYKKQKLDRDDIIDITDFDVVAWMKKEMRGKLEEELARAILIGDGRSSLSEHKIKEANIRPIYNDSDLYTIKAKLGPVGPLGKAHSFVKATIKAMADYEGKGMPTLYVEPYMLSDMLLIEDADGRFIYENESVLAKTLRVKEIIPVPVMKNLTRKVSDNKENNVLGIVVNPADYTVGADKGGQVAMFDDFDIDYNQQKYLIETRCSGSLLTPKTAITIEEETA